MPGAGNRNPYQNNELSGLWREFGVINSPLCNFNRPPSGALVVSGYREGKPIMVSG